MIDRVAPTRRPAGSPSGFQNWRKLLFVHWSFALEDVRPLVPAELELDAWEGRSFVGLVPFEMKGIRLAGFPRWAGLDFLETNLRTYVVHRGEPGVYFFSLEASSRLAVKAARWGWGLPYFDATMSTSRTDDVIEYRSTRAKTGASLHVKYSVGEPLGPSQPGSLEFFLLERYLLFTQWKGALWKGHVHHAPYPAHRATLHALEQTLTDAAGLPPTTGAPAAVHASPGVDVDVFGPHRVEP